MNKSMVSFKHETRVKILNYLAAKANKKDADALERKAKAEVKEVFAELGKEYKRQGVTDYLVGFIQKAGKVVAVVYKETVKRGSIDWEAYAKSLGGTDEGAEAFRKDDVVSVSIDYATEKQNKELGL